MKAAISPQDFEKLSAHLDGQLAPAQAQALLARLGAEPQLAAALASLTNLRTLLRRAPQRRVPRSFMLTPQMAGQTQRGILGAWSGFNFASAVAALTLIFVLVTDFSVNGLPTPLAARSAEPVLMMAEAPQAESYAAGGEAGNGPANEAADSAETLMLESMPADEGGLADQPPSMKEEAPATLTGWVAYNAPVLEALLASLAVIAGLLAWHHRRR
ncbi:MAG: hypothetical protein KIT08_01865 [Anaerolineales bacterium]|nr:MAG: hypothetical protein KIT08_01865 [Anaerolineales bacterium]